MYKLVVVVVVVVVVLVFIVVFFCLFVLYMLFSGDLMAAMDARGALIRNPSFVNPNLSTLSGMHYTA